MHKRGITKHCTRVAESGRIEMDNHSSRPGECRSLCLENQLPSVIHHAFPLFNRFKMFDCLSAMNLLASHTMPNLLLLFVVRALMWSIAPVSICAALGAKTGWMPSRRAQLSGATFGVLTGSVTTMLVAILMQAIIPLPPPWSIALSVGCLAGCCVAYTVACTGRRRPANPVALDVSPQDVP